MSRQHDHAYVSNKTKPKSWNCVVAEQNKATTHYLRGGAMISLAPKTIESQVCSNNVLSKAARALWTTPSPVSVSEDSAYRRQVKSNHGDLEREGSFRRVKDNTLEGLKKARKNVQDCVANMKEGSGEWQQFQKELRKSRAMTNVGVAMMMNCHLLDRALERDEKDSASLSDKAQPSIFQNSASSSDSRTSSYSSNEWTEVFSPSLQNRRALVSPDTFSRLKRDLLQKNELDEAFNKSDSLGTWSRLGQCRRLSIGNEAVAFPQNNNKKGNINRGRMQRRVTMTMIPSTSSTVKNMIISDNVACHEAQADASSTKKQTWTVVERNTALLGVFQKKSTCYSPGATSNTKTVPMRNSLCKVSHFFRNTTSVSVSEEDLEPGEYSHYALSVKDDSLPRDTCCVRNPNKLDKDDPWDGSDDVEQTGVFFSNKRAKVFCKTTTSTNNARLRFQHISNKKL